MSPRTALFVASMLVVPPVVAAVDPCQQGKQALEKNDFDRAIACFSEAIRRNPRDVAAYVGRADAHDQKNEFEKALSDCEEAIRLDAKCARAYHIQGRTRMYLVLGRAGMASDGRLALDMGRFRDPDRLPWSKEGKEEWCRALADFDRAISLDRADYGAYWNRGFCYQLLAQPDKALADLNQAFRVHSPDSDDYELRASAYALKNDYHSAAKDLSAAIRLQPKRVNAYTLRSHVWLQMNQYEQAMATRKKRYASIQRVGRRMRLGAVHITSRTNSVPRSTT